MPPTQHPPEHPIPSRPDLPPTGKSTTASFRGLGHLLMTRPLVMVGGLWMSLLLIALVAIGGLLSPGASERRSVSTTVVGSDSTIATQPAPQQARVPLWMFGAIALTCTAGSILVSRQLNRPPVPPRRISKSRSRLVKRRLQPQPTVPLALPPMSAQSPHQPLIPRSPARPGQRVGQRPAPQLANTQASLPPALVQPTGTARPVERTVLPPLLKRSSIPAKVTQAKPAQARAGMPRPTVQTSVRILPPDIRKPLDWQTTELADAVDLRKRRSLSSLL